MIAVSVAPASRRATTESASGPMTSGSPIEKMTLDARSTVACSLGGTPIIEQMISSGSGAARSATKSPVPSSKARATTSAATRSMESSMAATWRGLNAFETILRRRACLGSSLETRPEKYSTISGGRSNGEIAPGPERKTSGRRDAVATSRWRVSA